MSIPRSLAGCVVLLGFAGCASVTPPPPMPVLAYAPQTDCASAPDMSQAMRFAPLSKAGKRMLRNRAIEMDTDMEEAACLQTASGASPYAIYALPEGMSGRVVYAGSLIDVNSIFAARVSTLDAQGGMVREFEASDYKRTGSRHAVQFRPKDDEVFVLITSDPALVGEVMETSETRQEARYVSNGLTGAGGTNIVGRTQSFDRRFSYDGLAGIRVMFPKQEKPN